MDQRVTQANLTQQRTRTLLHWLQTKTEANGGRMGSLTNADNAAVLKMTKAHGRVLGNIQSRIDYACYLSGLPPLGLTAQTPFKGAWKPKGLQWAFPVPQMQAAAQAHVWNEKHFAQILDESERLPGLARLIWGRELSVNEKGVHDWAFGLLGEAVVPSAMPSKRRPPWSRNELVLALDLYLRFRDALPGPSSPEVVELSNFLGQMGRISGRAEGLTYRNPNGVYMKMSNFRRLDPAYLAEGKVGLRRGNKLEKVIWKEFSLDLKSLAAAVAAIRALDVADEPTYGFMEEDPTDITLEKLAALEKKYLNASVEKKEKFSGGVERGPVGGLVKKANGYKCQLCAALGVNPIGFLKKNGKPYIEAHHVMPVSELQVGSLAASNVMTLCANHHRQIHYGAVDVEIQLSFFDVAIDGVRLQIPRLQAND